MKTKKKFKNQDMKNLKKFNKIDIKETLKIDIILRIINKIINKNYEI